MVQIGNGGFRNPPFAIPGGPGPPFEYPLLVGGFNPQNPQRFGGSVAEISRSRTVPGDVRGTPRSFRAAEGGPTGEPRGSKQKRLEQS